MLTVEDFFITSVSSDKDMGKRPAKILMSDKKALFLPTEMSAIHLEHTEYFFDHKTSIASMYDWVLSSLFQTSSIFCAHGIPSFLTYNTDTVVQNYFNGEIDQRICRSCN